MRRLLIPHLAVWVVGATLLRGGIALPETCPPADADDARLAAVRASEWLARHQHDDGTFTYGYRASTDTIPDEYSAVRHALATYSLFRLGELHNLRFFFPAEDGLAHMLDNLVEHGDWVAYAEPGTDPQAGANGGLIAALASRRIQTGEDRYDDLMRDVGRFIVGQQEENGAIRKFWSRAREVPVDGAYGIFATGEAFWGLALLDTAFPGEGWDEAALRTARYLATERDRAEGQVTRYPDHWAAYGLAELAQNHRLDDELVDYARALAGFFSVRLRVESQRTGEGLNVLVRGWRGPPSGVATAGEGLAAIWRMGEADDRVADMQSGIEDDLHCFAGIMATWQVHPPFDSAYPRYLLARGAWFYRDYTQMDDQQHGAAALIDTAVIMESG